MLDKIYYNKLFTPVFTNGKLKVDKGKYGTFRNYYSRY